MLWLFLRKHGGARDGQSYQQPRLPRLNPFASQLAPREQIAPADGDRAHPVRGAAGQQFSKPSPQIAKRVGECFGVICYRNRLRLLAEFGPLPLGRRQMIALLGPVRVAPIESEFPLGPGDQVFGEALKKFALLPMY